jgi:hypothetical protein
MSLGFSLYQYIKHDFGFPRSDVKETEVYQPIDWESSVGGIIQRKNVLKRKIKKKRVLLCKTAILEGVVGEES